MKINIKNPPPEPSIPLLVVDVVAAPMFTMIITALLMEQLLTDIPTGYVVAGVWMLYQVKYLRNSARHPAKDAVAAITSDLLVLLALSVDAYASHLILAGIT